VQMDEFLRTAKLHSREEILMRHVVPRSPGVYAWWFRQVPPAVPTQGCITRDGLTLLYVGIAPSAPTAAEKPASKATLRSRLRQHMRGNASGSTLRLTVGCLLREQLGIDLRRVGSGERMTFAEGEAKLNDWLGVNARVCWTVDHRPWEIESAIISSACLPLNLAQNKAHPFHAQLSECRATAKRRARELPVYLRSRPA
jgi:hypothetical protein